jgi:CubicO group peptidase (beta-lactamase class C family)
MIMRRVLIGILLTLTVSAPTFSNGQYGLPAAEPESQGLSTEKLGAIKANLQPLIDEHKVPGFITVVARNGRVVHAEAFGSMDVERQKAMRPDTIFRMASMTKPITGAAVMILVQEGKVAVSDPLSKYLPEFAEMRVLLQDEDGASSTLRADKPITIEHLLTHTSGLTYGFFPNAVSRRYAAAGLGLSFEQLAALRGSGGVIRIMPEDYGLTTDAFVKKAAEQPLLAQPGTQWNYSIAMDVLGCVVEVVSGQRYGEFLQERIFTPLGMKDAGFHVPKEKVARFAANYAPQATGMILTDDPAKSSFLKIPSRDSGGGGMVGTAADYLRFAQMLLNGGELDGVRILSEESVREMTSDHLGPELGEAPLATVLQAFEIPPEVAIPAFRGIGFGYCGSVVRDGAGNTPFGAPGHYSWGGAWSTDFWIDRRQKLVGLVLTQITSGTYPVRMILNNATYEALVKRYD